MDKWDEVMAELEHQLRFLDGISFPAESRTRTTMQCQRLIKNRYVALAVPVIAERRPGTADAKGPRVIGFTDAGPWMFSANPSNPGLPRLALGPIDDPSPMTFGRHDREGGLLTIGGRRFLVPHAYAESVRNLIIELATRQDEADS